jgi:hypothetical protein
MTYFFVPFLGTGSPHRDFFGSFLETGSRHLLRKSVRTQMTYFFVPFLGTGSPHRDFFDSTKLIETNKTNHQDIFVSFLETSASQRSVNQNNSSPAAEETLIFDFLIF